MLPLGTWRLPIAAGAVTLAALLAADLLAPRHWRDAFQETAFDLVLAADQRLRPPAADRGPPVVVVDIDRRSLEAVGAWPWPRATMALLVDAMAAAKPSVAAIDILFAEHEGRSPVALADKSSDGDRLLAEAVGRLPLVLGFVLDPKGASALPQVAVAVRGSPSLDELWSAAGADAPPPLLTQKARGVGALSLPADADGVVRNVPLLVSVGGHLLPGFAAEATRVARGASVYLLQAPPPILAIGGLEIPLQSDGFLRLRPATSERRAARTISAIDVLQKQIGADRLAGAVALLGGSAPELGGLRRDRDRPADAVGSHPGRRDRADHGRAVPARHRRRQVDPTADPRARRAGARRQRGAAADPGRTRRS